MSLHSLFETDKARQLFVLMRPHQYIKNVFIFCAAFFSATLFDGDSFVVSAYAFFSFCLVASAVYVFNDLMDIDSDKCHPVKKYRPLACGKVNNREAIILFCILLSSGLVSIFFVDAQAFCLVSSYFILNVCYTVILKHYAILDIVIISLGFVIRLFVGSVVVDIELSDWIIIMTFLLALFLALAKRRADVVHFNRTGDKARRSLDGYNLTFVDLTMTLTASIIIVTYIMYTITPKANAAWNNDNLYVTTLFVIIGLLRYLKLTLVENKSGSPTKLVLQDRFTQFNLLAWVFSFYWIIYA
ncbi:MAG: decaprenyl-phosphate phosphoribosyltransferase [Alteromonadaceae bacterium]|nr:decaprenyl-phosphate phosphoribosyltransferase [Alteromonadaceae bacterium]